MLGQKKERVSKVEQEKTGILKEKWEKEKRRWTPKPLPPQRSWTSINGHPVVGTHGIYSHDT